MKAILALSALVLSFSANGYDVDTHFYSTYAMARHACIRHEVAVKIATATQWMDESFLSDPTSMIILVFDGIHKRRLLHFPATRVGANMSAKAQQKVLGFDKFIASHEWLIKTGLHLVDKNDITKLDNVIFFSDTVRGSVSGGEFASQMFSEAIKEGDLMKAGAGLHVLEDSFAHAGTPAEDGHAAYWHWPDRPQDSPEKYEEMNQAVFRTLVVIRSLLPKEALDHNLHSFGAQANCEMDDLTLAKNYFSEVKDLVSYNVLHDIDYVQGSLYWFLNDAVKSGYLHASEKDMRKLIAMVGVDGQMDTYQALARMIKILWRVEATGGKTLEWRKVLAHMGRLRIDDTTSFEDYVTAQGREPMGTLDVNSSNVTNFIDGVTRDLLKFNVPYELSKWHRREVENDDQPPGEVSIPRTVEMAIREKNIKDYIFKKFGIHLQFLPNKTSDEMGFGKEVRLEAEAESQIPNEPGVTYATFSLAEKNLFDHLIFKYLYPSTAFHDLDRVTAAIHRMNLATYSATWLADAAYSVLWEVRDVVHNIVFDLLNDDVHYAPDSDNFFYRNPYLFERELKIGRYKKFLGARDKVWKFKTLFGAKATENQRVP